MEQSSGRKSKILLGYSIAITSALVLALILGGVYYYHSLDTFKDTIKRFSTTDNSGSKPVTQSIEVNVDQNVLTFSMSGEGVAPGTFAVLDYTKSLTVIYDAGNKACYVIGGIHKEIADPKTITNFYEKNDGKPGPAAKSYSYQIANNYAISDKSMLPKTVQSTCGSLPTYWLEPATATTGIQKRDATSACLDVCLTVLIIQLCVKICATLDLGDLGKLLG